MIESFKIENYRGFKHFELSKLGRINLLVGENNSGKTSILEALHLFSSHNLTSLLDILNYRNEFSWIEEDLPNIQRNLIRKPSVQKYNITNLLYNYKIEIGNYLSFTGFIDNQKYELKGTINDVDFNNQLVNSQQLTLNDLIPFNEQTLTLSKDSLISFFFTNFFLNKTNQIFQLNIDTEGYLSQKNRGFIDNNSSIKSNLISPFYQDIKQLVNIFDQISLTPNEDFVIEALRIIEPKIKRIASNINQRNSKGSFKISIEGYEKPISIGSMGDGIWQLLTIALAMVNTQNGVLLIDEIDTGLHFTTLLKMWELILEISKQLNVQVFATTHNGDCWMALGELIAKKNTEENPNYIGENDITLHRIETDKKESILFKANEIAMASNREIEVR